MTKRLHNIDIIFDPDTQKIRGASVHYLDGFPAEDFPAEKLNELLPNNPGYAVEIAGLKEQLENSVSKSEFEAVQKQLEQAQKSISEIREKGAADVMAEFQRRVCEKFEVPDWATFTDMRSNGVQEASDLVAKAASGKELTKADTQRMQVLSAGKAWIEAMHAKANEIAAMSPMPLDITKDELWVL